MRFLYQLGCSLPPGEQGFAEFLLTELPVFLVEGKKIRRRDDPAQTTKTNAQFEPPPLMTRASRPLSQQNRGRYGAAGPAGSNDMLSKGARAERVVQHSSNGHIEEIDQRKPSDTEPIGLDPDRAADWRSQISSLVNAHTKMDVVT